ncbi:MAG: methyltransferase domain-containing protein [Rhodospirillaceae bacterium]|jgi:pseudaminic acid biosynthesis-associated methylase|nr:methyltransferase domain-containing protein [Rhodospirillaceae bacterium]MBT5374866.1 methyltransferase domain-containing protein [Rhodospirillaceae bacterium]MBT5658717.1 methyltransferase domain-containing protein [Rhodospirillaceae bacterium]MBT5751570.1 methyltransferase domain-containing protein [Rhodospirillaceae bacterium]
MNKKNGENELLQRWRGEFGSEYIERNAPTSERAKYVARGFAKILAHLEGDPPESILEIGANIGLNLRGLSQLTSADLYAVEPNESARETLIKDNVLPADHVFNGHAASLPFKDGEVDLAFTSTVLIHVPDDSLDDSYREIHRVAKKYILSLEYFSPTPATVSYHGHDDMLFKRDYGGLWLDGFADLQLVADGFFWKRTTGFDDVNWWLFRKR